VLHIKGTTTEIEDEDISLFVVFFVETVCNSGSGGLIDNTLDVHACNSTGIFGSLTLGIVEVSGDSDDSVVAFARKVSLCDFLHLGKNHG